MATGHQDVRPGDLIDLPGRHVGEAQRHGEILEVLGPVDHPHYRVRWNDGRVTLFHPGPDASIRHGATSAAAHTVDVLRRAGVDFEVMPHRHTATAASEARALGVKPEETAKTLVADVDGVYVRAVVRASDRLDLRKLAAAVGGNEAKLVSEAELAGAYPQFELGAVPPFAGPDGDAVLVDTDLAACERVVVEAGVHDESVRLLAADLVEVSKARVADIAAHPG